MSFSETPTNAFISYSHADEKALERLHKHFAMLQRDGLLSAWFDHAILPGANFEDEIRRQLERSELFLALVSPDYLASNFCYEKEFEHATALARQGKLKLVPIILEPCDWLSSPLSQFMALPRDGKPVSEWTNPNNAYLDVVNGLRRLLTAPVGGPSGTGEQRAEDQGSARRVRLKRDFDVIERAQFADQTFQVLQEYFRAATSELSQASEDLRTSFEAISPTAFTCSIVNRASRRHAESHITVHNAKRRGVFGDISYVYERHAEPNTSQGAIRVEADDYNLYLVTEAHFGGRTDGPKLTPERAAEWLWNHFVERAGVEYE